MVSLFQGAGLEGVHCNTGNCEHGNIRMGRFSKYADVLPEEA